MTNGVELVKERCWGKERKRKMTIGDRWSTKVSSGKVELIVLVVWRETLGEESIAFEEKEVQISLIFLSIEFRH